MECKLTKINRIQYIVPPVTIQGNDKTDENHNITDYLSKFNTKKSGDHTKSTDEPAQH